MTGCAASILAIHRDREGSLTGRAEIALARAIDLYGTIAREYDDEQVRRLAEAQRRALTKHLKRLTNPTQAQRLERATRRLYSAWSQRSAKRQPVIACERSGGLPARPAARTRGPRRLGWASTRDWGDGCAPAALPRRRPGRWAVGPAPAATLRQ